ncbi:MinD/ParA family ATP-binding protein [Micromonospora sp. CA-263727]|uniref:MinD/ParA family ATP-binding protein n=1 Tax=Micromonospora sp. CA-263727 TaxID=3239967 RepID=UPI003D8A319D
MLIASTGGPDRFADPGSPRPASGIREAGLSSGVMSPPPVPPAIKERATTPLVQGLWWKAQGAEPSEIPREFGAGSQVESLWLRAAGLRPGCPLVCLSSADGGVGRSTLTAAVGAVLALAVPGPVVAVDASLRAWGGLEHRVPRRSAATVWDAVSAGEALSRPPVVERLTQLGPTGLRVLVGESTMTSARRPPSWPELFAVVGYLRSVYALAVLDLRAADVAPVWRALAWATAPVLVSRASVDSLQHTMRLLAQLQAVGLREVVDRTVVVVMAASPSTAREVRAVEQLARQTVAHLVRVPYDPALARPESLDPRSMSKATRSALVDVAAAIVDRCPVDLRPDSSAADEAATDGGSKP